MTTKELQRNFLKTGRTIEQTMLNFNASWASMVDHGVKQYKITKSLGNPVGEIPSQLIRPLYGRFLKNVVQESPAVSTEIGLPNQGGTMYYTELGKKEENTMAEHSITSAFSIVSLCAGNMKLVDYFFQPTVRMSKDKEDRKYLKGSHVRGNPSLVWLKKPFKRYVEAKFPNTIYTWQGNEIDIKTWTWKDHIEQVIMPHEVWGKLYTESDFS